MEIHQPDFGRPTEDVEGRRSYRLDCREHCEPRLVNFYDPEEFQGVVFRWSKPVAMIRLEIPVDDYHVTIETSSLRGGECDFQFELIWNDHVIPAKAVTTGNGQIKFSVSKSMFVSDREQRLTVTCKSLDAEKGRRKLGMPIAWVELVALNIDELHANQPFTNTSQNSWNQLKTKRLRRFRRRKTPEPNLPIWQVEMPSLPGLSPKPVETSQSPPTRACDSVVVSSVEINARHGTGLLVQYMFGDFSDMATVISQRCYNGDRVRSAVHHELPKPDMARHEIYQMVLDWFKSAPPKRAYVVPFFETDMIMGMALKDLFNTKICLHIMDDNCIYSDDIPLATTEEAIRKSDLCFAISPEMRNAYEQRFGLKMWVLPPVVPDHLIAEHMVVPEDSFSSLVTEPNWKEKCLELFRRLRGKSHGSTGEQKKRGILIGNIWDRDWLELLRTTIRESGLQLDWYSNNPEAVWLKESTSDLDKDGIHLHDALWGEDLVRELKTRPFAVMPSGKLDQGEMRESIARLSLPSRVPFVVATSQIPVVVIGSPETSAARFVNRFQLGCVADYDGASFRQAAESVSNPESQQAIRQRAHSIAKTFSDRSMNEWIWRSLENELPVDDRFEDMFAPQPGEFSFFIDAESPRNIHWDKRPLWQMLRRLKYQGVAPEMIIDVGASDGVWSATAARIFPEAQYVLVDPLISRYNPEHTSYHLNSIRKHELIEAALSNQSGQTSILISDDLYGSSLLNVNDSIRKAETAVVDVRTLDELARQRNWQGKTLMKLDVQFAEHLVIEGGLDFIRRNVDVMILELTIEREHPDAKTYREMLDMMSELGYCLIDEAEGWRNPRTGRLEQKDAVFVRAADSARLRAA